MEDSGDAGLPILHTIQSAGRGISRNLVQFSVSRVHAGRVLCAASNCWLHSVHGRDDNQPPAIGADIEQFVPRTLEMIASAFLVRNLANAPVVQEMFIAVHRGETCG
jgi:hypothetical protein